MAKTIRNNENHVSKLLITSKSFNMIKNNFCKSILVILLSISIYFKTLTLLPDIIYLEDESVLVRATLTNHYNKFDKKINLDQRFNGLKNDTRYFFINYPD